MHTSDGVELAVVSDEDARAAAIKERRLRLGIRSQSAAAAESTRLGRSIDRGLISDAERGTASDDTYRRLDLFYDAFEEAIGDDDGVEGGTVTVQISGNFGVSATVHGPVGDLEELQALATALIREMRSDAPE